MNMWFLDGPEYYDPTLAAAGAAGAAGTARPAADAAGGTTGSTTTAKYLTYDNDVRRVVAHLTAERFNGLLPPLYKHMIAVSYQLAQFRWAGWVGGQVGGQAGCCC